ncbi:MAG TPA: TorF family putative porin [Usitatibacter sp.]|jgi:uncharacterized protein (TIGR02001 family)|nr:TorF family putative porin [Usitatibacter sp.]
MRLLPKVLLLAGAAGLTFSSLVVRAEDTPPAPGPGPQPGTAAEPAPTPDNSFTGKVAVYSEYEYRGISQTSQNPALQLNLDYANAPTGLYLGTFLSNIKWLKDTATANGFDSNARVEWDIYGGWRKEVYKDTTLDVGVLRYEYPSSGSFNPSPNTTEVYAGVTWQWLNIKYSYSLQNTFGVANSKHSDYIEANVAYPTPGFEKLTLTGTLAHQRYKGTQDSGFDNGDLSYTVWKVGASYDFGHNINAGAYYKGTDATSALYTVNGKDWSKDRLVAFVSYSF